VAVARGEFICRMDEHQMVGQGFDRILAEDCPPNSIITPLRYFLDPVKWEVMDLPPVGYMKLKITGGKFSGVADAKVDEKNKRRGNKMYETQAMQGSMWVMPRKVWDEVIGELNTELYGPHQQDSHEMVFKLWKAGGKLLVDINTWHAHKHRSFSRTHNNGTTENPANCEYSFSQMIKIWGPYYEELKSQGKL
jgi:hypothetical protein